jgi:hypothetical protein
MFSALTDYVKLSAASVANRFVGMALIAIPFMLAAGFGLAAIHIAISNVYTPLTSAIFLTIAFSVIGLIVAAVVAIRRRRQQALADEALTHARSSLAATALMANPVLLLGAGRVAFRLIRQAPLLTILPIAAGVVFAISRSSFGKSRVDEA